MPSPFDSIPPTSAPEYTRPPDETYTEAGDEDFRRHQVVNHLVTERLVERITGRGEGQSTLYGVDPRVRFFAATLSNQYEYRRDQETDEDGENVEAAGSSMQRNISPFTTGLKIKVDPEELDGPLRIQPDTKLFYKRFPEYSEQLEYSDLDAAQADGDEVPNPEREVQADGGSALTTPSEEQSLLRVYERVDPSFESIVISKAQLRNKAQSGGEITIPITDGLRDAEDTYRDDERALTAPLGASTYDDQRNVPPSALESESSFDEHLDSVFTDDIVNPHWEAEIRLKVGRRNDGKYSVNIQLVNTHGEDPEAATEPDEPWQTFLFDASVTVSSTPSAFAPFASEKVQARYQYKGNIYAIGQNCAAAVDIEDGLMSITTQAVPIYQQPKYLSRDTVPAPTERLAEGEFEPVLEGIQTEMARARKQYLEIQEQVLEGKGKEAEAEYEEMLNQFEMEQARFERGKDLLLDDSNTELRAAFESLNRTFAEEFENWRLFQIVFIVMSIPDMGSQCGIVETESDTLDVCDIIFFPTGGGKTEAYLGLVTFTAFLDRLRGKNHGLTGLTKFPLRLLSLQQLQRIANTLCTAEKIRREHPEMGGEEFSVGYFVGKQNTPNGIFEDNGEINNVELAANSEQHQEQWLTVPKCPHCDEESVEVTGDVDRLRIIHRCTNPECPEVRRVDGDTAELPIYITDNEIYRYAPTFVVSTIDKIAVVGMNRRARGLLGKFKHRCPDHGFTTEEECLVSGGGIADEHRCGNTAQNGLEEVKSVDPPSLLIQDELHLLREEFGAFDSHYETLIQKLIREYTDAEWEMKTVAATATIEGAPDQVDALYRKEPNEFPSQGPRLRQSFYAYEDPHRLGRQMVGALPRSIGRTRAINIVTREYAQVVQYYEANLQHLHNEIEAIAEDVVSGPLGFSDDEATRERELSDVLDDYKVQVSYNISKKQSDLLQRSIKGMVNRQLDAYGEPYERLTPVSLTGETDMEEVRSALSRLEADDPADPIDVVIATSMISHGVDVDRFNFISFFGMPRNTAEYIQAYSRVGRDNTGSVFVLFDSIKARDRSHYSQFEHYHRYQDLLVEATPLERWAEFAIECTIPGIVLGCLLQYYDMNHEQEFEKRIYNLDGFHEAVDEGVIDHDELLQFVLEAYDVAHVQDDDSSDIGARLYYESIEREFERIWERLLSADPEIRDPRKAGLKKYLGNVMEDEEAGLRGPMRSLRDIDEQIPVVHGLATSDMLDHLSEDE